MKKKYIIITTITLAVLIAFITYSNILKSNEIYEEENISEPIKVSKNISMNLEQNYGQGDYKAVTQSDWPTSGYIFNATLSRCESGSELSWDNTKKIVLMSGNSADKCYVYFDKILDLSEICTGKTLSECVTAQYTGTQGSSGLYYHNSTLANGAGDNSYRYAGANPNNFVCFGSTASPCPTDNLYRIIGVIDGKVRLIKYDYATSDLLGTNGDYSTYKSTPGSTYRGSLTEIDGYRWNQTNEENVWSESNLNKVNLNTNFITNIGTTWASKIATTIWKVAGGVFTGLPSETYQNEIANSQSGDNSTSRETEYSGKIGLMYVSDYGFAASSDMWTLALDSYTKTATDNNWMYMGAGDWTISPMTTMSDYVHAISATSEGKIIIGFVGMDSFGVRFVFNLESSVTYSSGGGSSDNPIRIN